MPHAFFVPSPANPVSWGATLFDSGGAQYVGAHGDRTRTSRNRGSRLLVVDASPGTSVSAPERSEPVTTSPALSGADDSALVAAMARGDQSAAAQLYDRHSGVLFA